MSGMSRGVHTFNRLWRWCPLIAVIMTALLGPARSLAQSDCSYRGILPIVEPGEGNPCAMEYGVAIDTDSGEYRWGRLGNVPDPEGPGDRIAAMDHLPVCWGAISAPYDRDWTWSLYGNYLSPVPPGFGTNVSLLAMPSLGDFLPGAPTIGTSDLALLPLSAQANPTGWQGRTRPVLDGVVDMITGAPLIQQTDLELGFGSSKFRLTRTRSAIQADLHNLSVHDGMPDKFSWWDWTGTGWMIGENPILFIDSALPDLVGPEATTIWLALDAHHSIPFQMINLPPLEGDTRPRVGYEAPPRFHARITCQNGSWGVLNGSTWEARWEHPPTQYQVWLYDGQVKLTFVAILDDVPPHMWDKRYESSDNPSPGDPEMVPGSLHDRPIYRQDGTYSTSAGCQRGYGVPHYGICVKMETPTGDSAEIHYCRLTRESIDRDPEDSCVECQQLCLRKGQISYIQLRSGETVKWTLLYAHRLFSQGFAWWLEPGASEWPDSLGLDETRALFGSIAIDRIYAFEGDVIGEDVERQKICMTLPTSDDPYSGTPADPLAIWNAAHAGAAITQAWTDQVHYWYETTRWYANDHPLNLNPTLVRTEVSSREVAGGTPVENSQRVRNTIFRYENSEQQMQRWLQRVYTQDDLDLLAEWCSANPGNLATWFQAKSVEDFAMAGVGSQEYPEAILAEDVEALRGFASINIDQYRAGFEGTGSSEAPGSSALLNDGYLAAVGADASQLIVRTGEGRVGVLGVKLADGQVHQYRIYQLLAAPEGYGEGFHARGFEVSTETPLPWRSLRVHPYRWIGLVPSEPTIWSQPGQLDKARWVSIVDEFDSRADAISSSLYGGDYETKRGQISRRVISMNPAGYVLTDKSWRFHDGVADVTGGGLGEQFIYKSIGAWYSETHNDDDPPEEWPSTFVNEPLLVERRSVGWSAAELADEGDTKGLIRRFEYEYLGAPPDLEPQGRVPWNTRIRKIGEKIACGTSDTGSYTVALYYDDTVLGDLVGEVEFLDAAYAGTRPNLEACTDATRYRVTRWKTVRTPGSGEVDAPPSNEWPIEYTIKVDPPHQVRPGSAWYYPVAMQKLDPDSRLVTWTGSGLVLNPDEPVSTTPDPFESVTLTYTKFDANGQLQYSVDDAEPGSTPAAPAGAPAEITIEVPGTSDLPPNWGRLAATDALNWVTVYRADDIGFTDIYFHNGRRWARRTVILSALPDPQSNPDEALYREEPPDGGDIDATPPAGDWTPRESGKPAVRRDFVFNDLEQTSEGWVARSPGQVLDYARVSPPDQIFRPLGTSPIIREWVDAASNSELQREQRTSDDFYVQYDSLQTEWRLAGRPLRPIRTRNVIFVDQGDNSDGLIESEGPSGTQFLSDPTQANQPYFRQIVEKKLRPDQYGRLRTADMFDRNSDGVMAFIGQKQVNDLGEVYRERDMDGGITRLVKDSLGHVLRRYVGTRDDAWSSAIGENRRLVFDPDPGTSTNNMVLVERIDYGLDPNDAWLPIVNRRYTTNQGFADDWHLRPYAPAPAADPYGQATVVAYDWRMRPVRTDVHDVGDPSPSNRLSTTLIFLDHAGRQRLVVTYGGGTLPTLGVTRDPSQFSPTSAIPAASAFVHQSGEITPLSVVEMFYGPDGMMTERRTYDAAWNGTGSLPYQAEYTYNGLGGATVFRQGPGNDAEITVQDALGRAVSTATVRPSASGGVSYAYELARTDTTYDDDGNVKQTLRWERVVDGAGDTLDATNAVWSAAVNWYDAQNRLIASADAGTGAAGGGTFTCDGNGFDLTWYGENTSQYPRLTSATSGGVARGSVPAQYPLTINYYNRKGELAVTARQQADNSGAPAYTYTKYAYTGFGQIASSLENPFGFPEAQRRTNYSYRFGRLSDIEAVQPGGTVIKQATSTHFGVNEENGWGADVIDTGLNPTGTRQYSSSGSLVRSMHLPDPSGAASEEASVTLRYDFQGRLAERVDARGVVVRYEHDALDRLVSITVGRYLSGGDFDQKWPDTAMFPSAGEPADNIKYVRYVYAADQRTVDAYAYDSMGGNLVTHTRLEYDARGNLSKDWQSVGEEISSGTPKVAYAWDVGFADSGAGQAGRTRLASMTYPRPPGMSSGSERVVSFSYGTPGTSDDVLGRIRAISSTPSVSPCPQNVAKFSYVGVARRAGFTQADDAIVGDLGLDATASGDGVIGVHGLDAFGRIADLNVKRASGSDPTLVRVRYTYDLAGNRLKAVRTPRPSGAGANDTRQEQENGYDPFDRLTGSATTSYDASNAATALNEDAWTLDAFGNWLTRASTLPGGTGRTIDNTPDTRNRYALVATTQGGSPQPDVTPIYDRAGDLIFDGTYAYQYDGWGRLAQVNQASVAAGHAGDVNYVTVGELVKHFTYDGFGRLVRVQSPYPGAPGPNEVSIGLRSERFYYDGVRRVQETLTDPVFGLGKAMEGAGGEALQGVAEEVRSRGPEEMDAAAAPASLEAGQAQLMEAGGPISGGTSTTYLAREYVWGNGDWGVDELLAQFDQDRKASYPVQDAGGDVISLIDLGGGGGGTARTVANIVYDAYGRVIAHEHLYPHAYLRTGHKGLFFDRLDVGVADATTYEELPRLVAGSTLLGQNRNRTLNTQWGRFLQSDPNATGVAVMASLSFHGRGMAAFVGDFSLNGSYGDGANLYQCYRGHPLTGSDPLGLMSAIELGGVGSVEAMLAGFLNGVASVGSSISGLMTSGGIWALNFTATGSLVAGYNFDNIMMMASQMDANGGQYWDDLVNMFGQAPDPRDLFTPAGRELSMHAIQRMGERGISSAQIDRVISTTRGVMQTNGNTNYYSKALDITVIFDKATNRIVTVIDGRSTPR